MAAPVPSQSLAHAYRHLYRAGLRAVMYAQPARFQLRDILREAFRDSPRSNFNPRRIQNTVHFLENSGNYSSYEHRIVKNICHMAYFKRRRLDAKVKPLSVDGRNSPAAAESRKQIWHQYRAAVVMLNESLDTCLAI